MHDVILFPVFFKEVVLNNFLLIFQSPVKWKKLYIGERELHPVYRFWFPPSPRDRVKYGMLVGESRGMLGQILILR